MRAPDLLERAAGGFARRPLATVLLLVLLAAGGGALALGLQPSAGSNTLVSSSSGSYRATADFHRNFGDDAVVVLISEQVSDLVLSSDLGRLIQLEGCIGGNVPSGQHALGPRGGPCYGFASLKPAKVVYGPGTFLNEAVLEIQNQIDGRLQQAQSEVATAQRAARALAKAKHYSAADQAKLASEAGQLAQNQATSQLERLAVQTGITSYPRIDDPNFISRIVFDPQRGANVPKARFAYLFPNAHAALIQVRLRANLSDSQRRRAIGLIRAAVALPQFRLQHGGSYTVTGVPVVVSDLAHSLTGSIVRLLLIALVVMALTLALVFRVARLRLLPLLVALVATGLTFGLMAITGIALTMASIAVLPVLIGLSVDYAIQFQSRVAERRRRGETLDAALAGAARHGGPTIAVAGLATAAGFLVLLLSPVPMVRGFGLLLVIGVALALGCALALSAAALTLAEDPAPVPAPLASLAPALRGAGEILGLAPARLARLAGGRARTRIGAAGRGARALPAATLALGQRRGGAVLGVAFVLAAGGWALDTQTGIESDIRKLVPSDLPALQGLNRLERATNVSGEIDVTVKGRDLGSPAVVRWMSGYQQALISRYGYSETKGCGAATLCPAFRLADLFGGAGSNPTRTQIQAVLALPPYFSQPFIAPDHREATLAFGIRLMPLARQQKVIDDMRSRLHPPKGVTAHLAGLPVLAAEANAALAADWRRALTLVVGLLAVGLVLMGVLRRRERALLPLVPIALATGWSALVLFALRIPLNPMSATLGALVIAISTEFSVLLSERFRQERAAGRDLAAALRETYRSTGAAVLASGVTAVLGFGVLAFSDVRMLSEFGFVTVVDLSVSLAGVLVVLPAVLTLAERGELRDAPQRLRDGLRGLRTLRPRRRAPASS